MFRLSVVGFVLMVVAAGLQARTLQVDTDRLVKVIGPVDRSIQTQIARLAELISDESGKSVYVLVNSPGGSVQAGMDFINVIQQGKARGYTINCISGRLAASMGFQILAHCSNIYTLKHTKLLFHPPSVQLQGGATLEQLTYIRGELAAIQQDLVVELFTLMKFKSSVFWPHFKAETLWEAHRLAEHVRKIQIVQDIQGVGPDLYIYQRPVSFRFPGLLAPKPDERAGILYIAPEHIMQSLNAGGN